MRVFVCSSCGKIIEVARCNNQRGRDLQCPDCGGRVYREHTEVSRFRAGRSAACNEHAAVAPGRASGFRCEDAVPGPGSGRRRVGRAAGRRRSG